MIAADDRAAFVRRFGHLFEHSPWVVERAWAARPFADADELHHALLQTLQKAEAGEQLAVIRAHPQLGLKQALTAESHAEQAGAGLQGLTAEEFAHFATLNGAYTARFGFPFIICVRRHDKVSILRNFEARLKNQPDAEKQTALDEIGMIVKMRLNDLMVAS